jgi:hypothetical protein
MLNHAVQAGASWEQIGAARGTSAERVRQEYREWAQGQHDLWTGRLGGEPGRLGLDDIDYTAVIARADLADGLLAPDAGSRGPYADRGRGPRGRGTRWRRRALHHRRQPAHAVRRAEDGRVSPGTYDRQIIEWLSGWERATCAVIAGLVDRAYEAGASRALQAYGPDPAAEHLVAAPGQVAPDRLARDACMVCGRPHSGHDARTAGQ